MFLDLEPTITDNSTGSLPSLSKEIRFEDITFKYPGSERAAIRDLSIVFPAGKIIALVGENGEGKSTIMKLLCRFYDPEKGRILWDGVDLRDVPISELRRQITALFQAPYYYPESAHNNIAVGDIDVDSSQDAIRIAARNAAAHDMIMQLPHGYDTVLGKYFGGEDLSIGQWQRLSLARTFLRKANLIILDEPTSAMDAWTETEWLSRIREGCRRSHYDHDYAPIYNSDAGRPDIRTAPARDHRARDACRAYQSQRAIRGIVASANAGG